MLKELTIWLLRQWLQRMSPADIKTPGLLELNSYQAARIIELEQSAENYQEDYDALKDEYAMLAQRIKDEAFYIEPTEESLCLKLYRILQEQEKLPLTADDVSRALDVDIHEAENMAATGYADRQKKERIQRIDYLYVIKAAHRDRYKIGHSFNPEDRLLTFKTGSPEHLHILGKWPGGRHLEGLLHSRLALYGWQLEWFDLPEKIVDQLMTALNRGAVDEIPEFETPAEPTPVEEKVSEAAA